MFLMVLICTQNDKEKRFIFLPMERILLSEIKKKSFSEMLIETKFSDKKKE